MRFGNDMITFEEAVAYLKDMPRFTVKKNPADSRDLKWFLKKLGNPEKDLRIIHVAGTNGKGSVCAYMSSILQAAGYRTAVFTSPHLVDMRERFAVNGKMISEEAFLQVYCAVGDALQEANSVNPGVLLPGGEAAPEFVLNFYEYLFCMALLCFAEEKPDYCIIETGLGGRLDSTNAIGVPDVTVVTKIGYDHMAVLGDTLDKIAAEKAGIIKKGTKLVLESQEKDAMDVLLETAEKEAVTEIKIADMHDVTECRYENGRQYFSYQKYKNLEMAMLGVHQYENAAAAILAAEIFLKDRGISDEKAEYYIREGIKKTRWEGRMEILSREPFFMVDGAHNGNGVAALAESLRTLFPGEKFHFVMGVMADKNYEEMIEELLPLALDFKTVTVESERALAAQELSEKIRAKGICDAGLLHSFDELMPGRLDVAHKTIAFGSLYFVGEIEKYFQDVTKITKNLQIY
mgnify:CR=1 FL=1